jgi:secreted trypsin-like serine protease
MSADPAIVNGTEVPSDSKSYLWLASIQSGTGFHFCGGSLIAPSWILSAAHCVVSTTTTTYAVLGITDLSSRAGIKRTIINMIVHPNYTKPFNDIALFQLDSPITTLPIIVMGEEEEKTGGGVAQIAGWGATSSEARVGSKYLLEAKVPIQDYATCTAPGAYPAISISNITNICAGYTYGGVDTCQGDSGGPLLLLVGPTLIGVVSWGSGCARPQKYGVYTRVSAFRTWIYSITDMKSGHIIPPQPGKTFSPTTLTQKTAWEPAPIDHSIVIIIIVLALVAAHLIISRRHAQQLPHRPV